MDELLAKYVKIAKVDSAHIFELDKTMEIMRSMTNMDNQYTNESDNKEDKKDDVEDIHPGDKLVNYFNNGLNYNDDNNDEVDDEDHDRNLGNYDNAHVNANEGRRQYVASLLPGSNCCRQVLQCSNCFILQVTIPQLKLFVHRTQDLQDRLECDKEENSMTYQIMPFWLKCRTKLIHNYSLVGCILSPNPRIMNNARERILHSPIYADTVKCLIGKLLVPDNLSSNERKECLADLTTKFFGKHQKFVNQTGILQSNTMWYAAGKSDFVVECHWHYSWTLSRTKVLGKLSCLVLSKILGI
jgi:hypothetical protein